MITDKKVILAVEDCTPLPLNPEETLMLFQGSRLIARPVEKLNIHQPERHDKESHHHTEDHNLSPELQEIPPAGTIRSDSAITTRGHPGGTCLISCFSVREYRPLSQVALSLNRAPWNIPGHGLLESAWLLPLPETSGAFSD